MKKQKTKVSFRATRSYRKWEDREMENLHNKILRLEGELEIIRNKIFDKFTE